MTRRFDGRPGLLLGSLEQNDAIHWLDSTGLLLQTTGCAGRLFCCKNDNVFFECLA